MNPFASYSLIYIGFKPVGFIELATDNDRLEEYRRVAAFNRKCGVNVEEIGNIPFIK